LRRSRENDAGDSNFGPEEEQKEFEMEVGKGLEVEVKEVTRAIVESEEE
jgi:hypothetical protein